MTRRRITLGIVLLTGIVVAWPRAVISAEDSLFVNDEILEISINGPLKKLARAKSASTEVAGRLGLADGTTIPVTLSKYGISRLRECNLPLLKIEIDEKHARGTLFDGHPTVRLVTPCHQGSAWDRFILFEYLAYRSYAVIAEPALRARLAATRFLDSERSTYDETGLSFFIEDISAAADRYGMRWLDIESQPVEDLDPSRLALLGLFQYMIGNTDWSAVGAAEGKRCCHNVAVLGTENRRWKAPLPYDFDHAGLVNAPYALPDRHLPIRSVTQRWYRGFCTNNASIPEAIEVFIQKQPELEQLFTSDEIPDRKARKRSWKYIDAFYDTINDPKRVEKQILSTCR
jgi:hypothetical protein